VGGVASVAPDFVVDPRDERAMATAVSRVLDDASAAERALAGSSEVARTFSLEALVRRVDELYRRLL
jgi:glycosyltransferase involved in cell wall biosynthesis